MSRYPRARGRTTIVLFTRDLRVPDHPALAEAAAVSVRVVPLFVLDDSFLRSDYARPNRVQFLLGSLADLDASLRAVGSRLVVRRGDPVREALAVAQATGAQAIFTSADVSAFARRRARRLAEGCAAHGVEYRAFAGVTVVAPGALLPAGGDHFRVFTPYWNRWRAVPLRARAPKPHRLVLPPGLPPTALPTLAELVTGATSLDLMRGGETHARVRLVAWCRGDVRQYAKRHDALDTEGTSRLSPYLHFGCVSPVEVASRCPTTGAGEPFLRQLCWRDFHHQVTAAFPAIAQADYRPRGRRWRDDAELLEAWKAGRTGYPVIDAGMRQLAAQGWMHNRARLLTASLLVKNLGLDWRLGARHFLDLLVDGDIASNSGNWQWVAGTGNDTRPNRTFNPIRQALRLDPDGKYVRLWVPELSSVPGPRVHTPWALDPAERNRLEYCEPLVTPARGRA
jgi:deoxyribodipyrimidine photo-lyase